MKNINELIVTTPSKPKSKNSLIGGLFHNTSLGKTENDAITYTRTQSSLLDFFAQAGAMRNNIAQALKLFKQAYSEDNEKAVKILFYLRDIRGGQGERQLFRTCLQWLGETYPDIFEKILEYVPEYGRYDDLLFDNEKCYDMIEKQLKEDKDSKTPSLLAKWLPTINASSKTTKAKARMIANKIGLNEITYRKTVRRIRKQLAIVEEKMSTREWHKIDYSKVPSQASRIYKNTFRKHDEERYDKFIEAAEKGEKKINAGTLYPYQIYKSVIHDYSKTLEALWNQLPDYTRGNNGIVVADVSGSMDGDPMAVSVSLALYFAERNKGQFKDHFITFTAKPKLQRIQGNDLQQKMNSIETADWNMNTNLQAVFDLILNTATKNNTPKEEMPETIYIISDMEFDSATTHWDEKDNTNYEVIKEKYANAGYKKPNLVFWNVDARHEGNMPVQEDERGVAMVSGFSPVIFKMAMENKTPYEVMMDTVNSDRYKDITIK